MIFAEFEYPEEYWDFHEGLKKYLLEHFKSIECGLQTDSWFWIHIDKHKVVIDTFSSMKHQIKSADTGPHIQQVISLLQKKYKINVYPEPELEDHDYLS
ncbi:hypothetical protein EA797_21625 [Stutzerimonas zhaodongensis]|uniref:Uncharacterized protein n=1 Tax=Stutzerimonas zhaodongensis TaxID=1176257 RepID=A0A3M2HHH8_9GAMM|nr:hypothetical protein EA797_21625 [Stutzerimonas zhaodongensis]